LPKVTFIHHVTNSVHVIFIPELYKSGKNKLFNLHLQKNRGILDYSDLRLTDWLPTSVKEAKLRGWDNIDIVLFSGDAYVDHPSFGSAVIGRLYESMGLRVAIVPQPNWRDDLRDFRKFGKPRLFFGVSAGNMDSMVNHYTANRRLRSDDAYTPDGKAGFRPDYASVVYTKILKDLYPDVPVIIGGVEASLRRLAHYDYWKDELKPSILIESGADMLVYGMGEKPMREIVDRLKAGSNFADLTDIKQTCYINRDNQSINYDKVINLYSFEECVKEKIKHAKNFKHIEQESNKLNAAALTQKAIGKTVVVNPPYPPMTTKEIDASFALPYTRLPHPRYKNKGAIPAYEMIRHSVNIHRGCFGGCSFCTISAHQGKFIASRSEKSVLKEVKQVTQMPDFKGYISDIGGPSANMYRMEGKDKEICEKCVRPSCIYPKICKNLNTNHLPLTNLYKKARALKGVKKAFIGSGIRYDLFLDESVINQADKRNYLKEVIQHHVSGRLKVAPEHTEDSVLKQMRKPPFKMFVKLKQIFDKTNSDLGINQQLIPYFISSHPGCHEDDMRKLGDTVKKMNYKLEQVQDFTPTPMTVATVIYYSGYHPYTLEKTYTAISKEDKLKQRSHFFWYKNDNRKPDKSRQSDRNRGSNNSKNKNRGFRKSRRK
jgi:uncharacterized radical SAM protein YgiQ